MKSLRELLNEPGVPTGPDILALPPTATAFEAAQAMAKVHVGATLVVDTSGTPLGIFTERDLMTRVIVGEKDLRTCPLEAVMTRGPLFLGSPDAKANDVAREMQARHIRHVPVVEDGRVLGVLSLRDLLRANLEAKRHEVRALTAYIQGEGEPERREKA